MGFWAYAMFFGCIAVIWGFGWVAGRYSKAWKIANKPNIGSLLVCGEDLYLSLNDASDFDIIQKSKEVSMTVCIIEDGIAEKTESITE